MSVDYNAMTTVKFELTCNLIGAGLVAGLGCI